MAVAEEYIPGSVQLLRDLPVNSSFLEEVEEIIQPSQADEMTGQIDFYVSSKDMFMANKFLLTSTNGIRNSDTDDKLEITDMIARVPLSNLLAYKAMTLDINGESVERYNANMGYKSYFKYIAGHTGEELENTKISSFFYPDDPTELKAQFNL